MALNPRPCHGRTPRRWRLRMMAAWICRGGGRSLAPSRAGPSPVDADDDDVREAPSDRAGRTASGTDLFQPDAEAGGAQQHAERAKRPSGMLLRSLTSADCSAARASRERPFDRRTGRRPRRPAHARSAVACHRRQDRRHTVPKHEPCARRAPRSVPVTMPTSSGSAPLIVSSPDAAVRLPAHGLDGLRRAGPRPTFRRRTGRRGFRPRLEAAIDHDQLARSRAFARQQPAENDAAGAGPPRFQRRRRSTARPLAAPPTSVAAAAGVRVACE